MFKNLIFNSNKLVSMAEQLNDWAWLISRRNAFGLFVTDSDSQLDEDIAFLRQYIYARPCFLKNGTDIIPDAVFVCQRLEAAREARIKRKKHQKAHEKGVAGEQRLYHKIDYLPKESYHTIFDSQKHLYVHFENLSNELDCIVVSKQQRRVFILESKCWQGELRLQSDGRCKIVYPDHTIKNRPSPFSQVDEHRRLLEMILKKFDVAVTPIIVLTDFDSTFICEGNAEYPVRRLDDLLKTIESYDYGNPMSDDEYSKVLSQLSEHINFVPDNNELHRVSYKR